MHTCTHVQTSTHPHIHIISEAAYSFKYAIEMAASRYVYYLTYIFMGRIFKIHDLSDFLRTQYIVSLIMLYNGRLEPILPD